MAIHDLDFVSEMTRQNRNRDPAFLDHGHHAGDRTVVLAQNAGEGIS
jgi:hypothetical protein